MNFFKNLFTNDNSIIGLCGISSESAVITNIMNDYRELNYTPPLNPLYENYKIFKYMSVE